MKQVSFFYFVLLLIAGCEEPTRHGCLDSLACNYDSDAMIDDNSCIYSDCAGVCGGSAVLSGCDNTCGSVAVEDCAGVCGGDATPEECSECELGIFDCAGVCDGSAEYDECDVCDGSGIPDGACDCDGNVLDECGECGGGGSSCDEGLWNVLYDMNVPIAGFQFDVDGAAVISASSGAAEAAGFWIDSNASTVMGFSLSGSVIPLGAGILISLEIDGDANLACLSAVVISDSDGNAVDVDFTCNTIKD